MTETKNSSNRKLYYVLAIVFIILGIFGFIEARIDGKIGNHPKVVEMNITQGHIQAQYDELKEMLEKLDYKIEILDKKINQLLREEYP